ncbi:MAG TPA: DMT family transporter [Pseudolysinimonas sp.]|nr:DMT family transporter [Pseudolysinimonas sp.]
MLVVALIVAGAVSHATWNLLAKRASLGGAGFVWLTAVGAAIVTAPVAIVAAVTDPPDLTLLLVAAVVSGFIHIGYFLALQNGYRLGDVGVVYPLARGTGPLLSVIFAILLFGERPGLFGLLGAGAIILGVMVIGFAGGRGGWVASRAGVGWGLLTGVAIACYTLWDAHAVLTWSLAPVVLSSAIFAAEGVLLAPLVLRSAPARAGVRAVLREHRLGVVAVSVLSPLSYIFILQAIQFAPVSIVAPAREVSVVLVGLAGWLWFREPHPARRLAGAAIVLIGVILLGWSDHG